MSILIKGMEMPTNCYVCPFCDYVSARCDAVKGTPYTPPNRYEVTAEWCPLIELPPHGRLIDADVLEKVMSEGIAPSEKDGGFKHPFDIIRAVANAPTIIPADEMI